MESFNNFTNLTKSTDCVNKTITLYHGSKYGIKFPINIKQYSNNYADFGERFYLNNSLVGANKFIAKFPTSKLYKFELPAFESVHNFNLDNDWLLYILSCRCELVNICEKYKINIKTKECIFDSAIDKSGKIINYYTLPKLVDKFKEISNKEAIVGNIADDDLSVLINDFANSYITDEGFIHGLLVSDYGIQYAIKNDKLLNNAKIIEIPKSQNIITTVKENIHEITKLYRNCGKTVEELIYDNI